MARPRLYQYARVVSMDTMPPDHLSDAEQAALEEAERRGAPYLVLRDGDGEQRIISLSPRKRRYAIGRRDEADVALSWDREVSRLHATLERLAGEWTVSDDGLSQNGTFVNEIKLEGRRRLAEGDLIRVGRTTIAFHHPGAAAVGLTMLPGELGIATALSDQQHAVLRELCRPLMSDGEGIAPASDEEIALAAGIPLDAVQTELEALIRAFGFDDLPDAEARAEVAVGAIRTGLVRGEDFLA